LARDLGGAAKPAGTEAVIAPLPGAIAVMRTFAEPWLAVRVADVGALSADGLVQLSYFTT